MEYALPLEMFRDLNEMSLQSRRFHFHLQKNLSAEFLFLGRRLQNAKIGQF